MFSLIYILEDVMKILLASIFVIVFFTAGCSCDEHPAVYNIKEERLLLSIKLKFKIHKGMTISEIERLLGRPHETWGSGLVTSIWYFSDGTCLVIPGLKKNGKYDYYWRKSADFKIRK